MPISGAAFSLLVQQWLAVVRIPPGRDGCLTMIAKLAKKETMTSQVERELFEENKSAAETSAKG